MAAKMAKTELGSLALDESRYVALLRLVGGGVAAEQPAQDLYPREDNCSQHVLAALAPYSGPDGPLTVERVAFQEGRGNVIITYAGTGEGSVAFVGSHMDVVPANPETWQRNPFELTVEGDHLYGRGTTDCLGHVALITELMLQLAVTRPALRRTVTAVLIANEENGTVENIGVDQLMASGKMDGIRGGPVIWVDCADSQPCIGTAGSITWHMKATGKLFHSGLVRRAARNSARNSAQKFGAILFRRRHPPPPAQPHKGINALEMCNAAVAQLQDRFYAEFPAVAQEAEYRFMTCSTMKPTQVKCAVGSLNQLPPWVEISGDVRLTPFYEVPALRARLDEIVGEMNADLSTLPTRGPYSSTRSRARAASSSSRGAPGTWGIACTLGSEGNLALIAATESVLGEAKPYSICGSLRWCAICSAAASTCR